MESYTDAIHEFEQFGIEIATKPVRKFWVAGDKCLKVSVKVKAPKIGQYAAPGGIELARKSTKLEVKEGGTSNTINNADLLTSIVLEFTPKVYDAFFSRLFASDNKNGIKRALNNPLAYVCQSPQEGFEWRQTLFQNPLKIGTEPPGTGDKKQLYEHIRTSMEGFAYEFARKLEESTGAETLTPSEWFSKDTVGKIYRKVIDLLYDRIKQEKGKKFWEDRSHRKDNTVYTPILDVEK